MDKDKRKSYKCITHKLKNENNCVLCGESNPILLGLDHINPKLKSKDWRDRKVSTIKKDLDNIRILCVWCHRKHSYIQRENTKKENEKEKFYSKEENNMKLGKVFKKCRGILCKGKERNITFFYINKKSGKGYSKCKKCLYFYKREKRSKKQPVVCINR